MKSLFLETLGLAGSLFTLQCCLGFGPLIALLSATGAGFIVREPVLAPLLVFFMSLGTAGLWISRRRHRHWSPLLIHLLSAVTVLVFTFARFVVPLIWAGVAGLFTASIWDLALGKRAVGHGP